MFFNRYKKNGKEAGSNVLEIIIKKSFTGTRHFRDKMIFNPPEYFYEDKYVRGYISSSLDSMITLAFNGKDWSSTQKGEYFLQAMLIIDPSKTLWSQLVEMGENQEIALQLREDEDFKKGYNNAFTYLGTAYNRLPYDDPDPVLKEARKLAPALEKQSVSIGLDGGDHLAVAVYMLTFYKYVKDNWS